MREGSNSSPLYICIHPLYICIHPLYICMHTHHQCKMSVRMRVRERASLSEVKGGKDAKRRERPRVGETEGGLKRGGERALRKKNSQLNTPSDIHC